MSIQHKRAVLGQLTQMSVIFLFMLHAVSSDIGKQAEMPEQQTGTKSPQKIAIPVETGFPLLIQTGTRQTTRHHKV
jgi:hypothetical protein